MQVRACFLRTDEAPNTSPMIKGKVRGRPAVTGFSRVVVSHTCGIFGRPALARVGRLGKIFRGFEAPFPVRKLPFDASRVGNRERRHAETLLPAQSVTWAGGIPSLGHFVRRVCRLSYSLLGRDASARTPRPAEATSPGRSWTS